MNSPSCLGNEPPIPFICGEQHEIGCHGAKADGNQIKKVKGPLRKIVLGILQEWYSLEPFWDYSQGKSIEFLE